MISVRDGDDSSGNASNSGRWLGVTFMNVGLTVLSAKRPMAIVPPATNGDHNAVTVRSKENDVCTSDSPDTAGYSALARVTYAASDRCSTTTPFGVPVEPDV